MSAIIPLTLNLQPVYQAYASLIDQFPDLHKFIPKPFNQAESWSPKISALSDLTTYSTEQLNANWDSCQDRVVAALLVPASEDRVVLRLIFERLNPENLNRMLQRLASELAERPNAVLIDKLLRDLKLTKLEACVGVQGRKLAAESLDQYPDFKQDPIGSKTERKERANLIFRIIPDMLDTFLKAFNVLDAGKRPQSVWDYNALIAIYVTALSLPSFMVSHLLHFIEEPLYAYGTALGVGVAFACGLYAYLKWLRPIPHDFPNCINVSSISAPPFIDREQSIRKIQKLVENGFNVIIIGESGAGKSAIVREVGKRLQTKTMQQIKDGVFDPDFVSPVERLEVDFLEADNYPGKVVFYVDEMAKLCSNDNLLKHLQGRLEQKQFQIIGTCSREEYEKTIAGKTEFQRRFVVHELASPSEQEMQIIFMGLYRAIVDEIDCDDPVELVRYLIQRTNASLEQINCGAQPAAAIRVWERALMKIREFRIQDYESKELLDLSAQLKSARYVYRNTPIEQQNKGLDEIRALKGRIRDLEQRDKEVRQLMEKMRQLIRFKKELRALREIDSGRVAAIQDDASAKRLLFVSFFALQRIAQAIQSLEKKLPKRVKLRLSEELIEETLLSGRLSGRN